MHSGFLVEDLLKIEFLELGAVAITESDQDSGLVTFPERSRAQDAGHVGTPRCRATEATWLLAGRATGPGVAVRGAARQIASLTGVFVWCAARRALAASQRLPWNAG